MVTITFSNKIFYTILLLGMFLVTVFGVYAAYTTSLIPNPGHGGDTVWIDVEDEEMTLQRAIDEDFLFSKSDRFQLPLCEVGETLQFNYSATDQWECVDLEIYEPPFSFVLGDKSERSNYKCRVVDVAPWCDDEDGCRIDIYMVHENYYDQAKVISQHVFFEDSELSTNDYRGTYAWVRQEGGGDYALHTGSGINSDRAQFFSPWGWMWAHNYEHRYCDHRAGNSDILDTFEISFMTHPSIMARIIIRDK